MMDQKIDDVTLKDLIIKVNNYGNYLWHKKIWIILLALPFVLYFGYRAASTPTLFTAERKFFLEESGNRAGFGALGGVLGQFGVAGGKSNFGAQIIEVAKSKILLTEVLFEDEIENCLANYILEIYKLPEVWSEDKIEYKNFRFVHDSIDIFNTLELKVLNRLIKFILKSEEGPAIHTISFDEGDGIFRIQSTSINSNLSLRINELIYDKLKYYFEERVLRSQKETRDLLKIKLDSLNVLIANKTYKIAKIYDTNTGRIFQTDAVPNELLKREVSALSLAQAEVFRTYEMADYSYKNKKQIFMLVDRPFPPIGAKIANVPIEVIKGLILGIFLTILFFLARKIYLDALNEE